MKQSISLKLCKVRHQSVTTWEHVPWMPGLIRPFIFMRKFQGCVSFLLFASFIIGSGKISAQVVTLDEAFEVIARSNPQLARFAGHYYNDSPWWPPTTVVERGGKIWLGTETPLTPVG